MEKWLIGKALAWLVTALVKWGTEFDWAKFMLGADKVIADWLPGVFFDQMAVETFNALLTRAQVLLQKSDEITKILAELAEKDWTGALEALKAWLLDGWTPISIAEQKAHAALQSFAA